jgi:hypothetical protein
VELCTPRSDWRFAKSRLESTPGADRRNGTASNEPSRNGVVQPEPTELIRAKRWHELRQAPASLDPSDIAVRLDGLADEDTTEASSIVWRHPDEYRSQLFAIY